MNYELIAFDMDGTLLDTHKHVLPSSTEAINEATAAGKTVAICSGRCPKMVELDQASFGNVRYAICCNGSVIYDLHDHRVISTSSLDHEVIVQAANALDSEDALIDIFQGRGFFCQPAFCRKNSAPLSFASGRRKNALPSMANRYSAGGSPPSGKTCSG